jgi:UDP-N-acetyl-D-glucosamine dehydrogenase
MSRSKSVAIIGLGYVGLPLAGLFVKKGCHVVGIDLDGRKIKRLNDKQSYLSDLEDWEIADLMDSGRFTPTTDYAAVQSAGSVIICVPTPLHDRKPDLSYIDSAVQSMLPHLQPNQLIILESSTYPGTTEDYVKPILENGVFTVGKNLFLGYSPERVDPGNKEMAIAQIPKIISGATDACLKRVYELYSVIFTQVVQVSSPRVAEFSKMIENSQRLINISFINEVNLLANKMKVDLWEVIEAAKTKPMGFTPYYPSAGIGGHCIPVDPFFLSWVGMQEGVPLTMIHQAGLINDMIPHFIVHRVADLLSANGIPEQGANIGVIGLTYKKDVNDIRESASLKVIELLQHRRMKVSIHDPVYLEDVPQGTKRFSLTAKELGGFDVTLILVDHSFVDWKQVVKHSRRVIDTRNATKHLSDARIVRI